jgi:YfiH family protein
VTLPAIRCPLLDLPGISHAFFTREGGVSMGLYASLNGGTGSRDDAQAVLENRSRMAASLGVDAQSLLVPYQIHSADVVVATSPWEANERPRADGLVTKVPGLALGVTGADCGMILFADPAARVVGACHAGWKGAFTGILEATVDAMEGLGASRSDIVAVLGPTIGRASYEVGPEFIARFVEAEADTARLFVPSRNAHHAMFDLPAFVGLRLSRAGVGTVHDLALDTYTDDARFYSYRRSTHRAEADYGRLVSAIALA